MFTVEQINEISCKLNATARRDCDLPVARPLTGCEFVPLVQDAENRNASLMQVADVVGEFVIQRFMENPFLFSPGLYAVLVGCIGRSVDAFCDSVERIASATFKE